jgi:electron transfer flavoprotein beta subunit
MTGMASTDGLMGVVPTMLAERLGLPAVTFASELTVGDGTSRSAATTTPASQTIEATLPALVSVTDQINTPRYPSFKGIMAAKKKPLDTWSLADLGIEPSRGRAGRGVDQGRVVCRAPAASEGPDRGRRGATAARSSPRSSPSASSSDP